MEEKIRLVANATSQMGVHCFWQGKEGACNNRAVIFL